MPNAKIHPKCQIKSELGLVFFRAILLFFCKMKKGPYIKYNILLARVHIYIEYRMNLYESMVDYSYFSEREVLPGLLLYWICYSYYSYYKNTTTAATATSRTRGQTKSFLLLSFFVVVLSVTCCCCCSSFRCWCCHRRCCCCCLSYVLTF